MRKLLLLSLFATSVAYAEIPTTVVSEPHNGVCFKNMPCNVTSNHWAEVVNNTAENKTIYVFYEICPEHDTCFHRSFKVEVRAHGVWHDGITLTKETKFHYPGDYFLMAETRVSDTHHNLLKSITQKASITVHA